MAEQDFLASYGVQIDEEGVHRLHSILEENRQKAAEVSGAFTGAETALRGWLGALSGDLPEDLTVPVFSPELDLTRAAAALAAFMSSASSRFRLSADPSGLLSTASAALEEIRTLFAGARLSLKVRVETEDPADGEEGESGAPKPPGGGTPLPKGLGMPDGPEQPNSPELPDRPEIPVPTKASDEIRLPEIPEWPDPPAPPAWPDWPETPEWPDLPEAPEIPDLTDLPNLPEPPEIPDAPEWPEYPEFPEPSEPPAWPEMPEAPEWPGIPEPPEWPDLPEQPGIPEPNDVPAAPNQPGDTDTPIVSVPNIVLPEITVPEIPMPAIPEIPETNLQEGPLPDLSLPEIRWPELSGNQALAPSPAPAEPPRSGETRIEAPVTIQVTAAGTDPEALGESIYRIAQRYQLRTLQPVYT